MAIVKRKSKAGVRYQAKVKGTDGSWISETFDSKSEAEQWEARLKLEKFSGKLVTNLGRRVTVAEYFAEWFKETKTSRVSDGWRTSQAQIFRDYIVGVIGNAPMKKVTPVYVNRVLRAAAEMGRAEQTQLHIYNVLHKMFEDAIEIFQLLDFNPVLKRLKPTLPEKEAKYLTIDEVKKLLSWVRGKPYEVAIWLGVYAGRRVGEIQALRWEHVDFARNKIHVRATYARKEKQFRDYPKGRKWHSIEMPPELREILERERANATSGFVAVSPRRPFLTYGGYSKALKRYCAGIGITLVATHGLRHSTSEVWQEHGASRDDIRVLMAHSSSKVTDRYIHDNGDRLRKVANVIRLFQKPDEAAAVSQNVSQTAVLGSGLC